MNPQNPLYRVWGFFMGMGKGQNLPPSESRREIEAHRVRKWRCNPLESCQRKEKQSLTMRGLDFSLAGLSGFVQDRCLMQLNNLLRQQSPLATLR